MSTYRDLTTTQWNVLNMMSNGFTLVTEWPTPDRKWSYLRADGSPDVPVSQYDVERLSKKPAYIGHLRTDRERMTLYHRLTPAGKRAVFVAESPR